MISYTPINAKYFTYCLVYQGANETTNYYNSNDGHYHQKMYMIEGTMDIQISRTNEVFKTLFALEKPVADTMYDTSHTKDMYITAKTGDTSAAMIFFNPIPTTKELNVEIIKDAQILEVTATDTRKTIVCITGSIDINGKTLNSMQHAVVFPGKTATLTIEQNKICAIVSE